MQPGSTQASASKFLQLRHSKRICLTVDQRFLVYGKIPKAAIKQTFPVAQLMRLAACVPAVGSLLRLDQLSAERQGLTATIQPAFKAQEVPLDGRSISAMAEIALFLGLTTASAIEHVIHIVSDLIQGWAVAVSYQTQQKWLDDATCFASAMQVARHGSLQSLQGMKLAFLEGVRWSRGKDTSTRHNAESIRLMLLRARKIGLDDISKMLCNELDATKSGLQLFETRQQKLLGGMSAQHLLSAEEDAGNISPTTPEKPRCHYDEEIVCDTDDE